MVDEYNHWLIRLDMVDNRSTMKPYTSHGHAVEHVGWFFFFVFLFICSGGVVIATLESQAKNALVKLCRIDETESQKKVTDQPCTVMTFLSLLNLKQLRSYMYSPEQS